MTLSLSVLRKLICDFLKQQFANFLRLCLPRCFGGYKETERTGAKRYYRICLARKSRQVRGGLFASLGIIANISRSNPMTTLFCSAGGVGYGIAQNPNPISHRATARLATCANRNGGQNETSASKITTVAESKSVNHNARSSGPCRKINGLTASQHPSITSTTRAHIVSSL